MTTRHSLAIEYGYSNRRVLSTGLCGRSRRGTSLLRLGLAGEIRTTPQRRRRGLARCRNHHLHYAGIERGLHLARLGCWSSECRSVWIDLPGPAAVHAEKIPQAAVESGAAKQAISGHRGVLEWMGRCGPVLTICLAGHWSESELYVLDSLLKSSANQPDAPIIMSIVTIFALISYFVMPEEKWLPRTRISHFVDSKGVVETVEEVGSIASRSHRRPDREQDDDDDSKTA